MWIFRFAMLALVVLQAGAMSLILLDATGRRTILLPPAARSRMGNLLMSVGGAIMLFSGCLKFAHVPLVVEEMTALGMAGWKLDLVAFLEVASAALFLTPRLRSIGIPVATAYLGAAVAAHIRSDQYFAVLPTLAIAGSCWIGAALRYPHLLFSLAPRGDSIAPEPKRPLRSQPV